MKKKLITIISCLLAAVFGLGMFSGCELITTDNRADMEQVVAEVNIGNDTDSLNAMFGTIFGSSYELSPEVTDSLSDIVTTENVYKRDLVAYFINYGYSYVSSGSYTYAEVFEMLMNDLVGRKILAQYAIIYYLSEGEVVIDRDSLSAEVLDNLSDYGYEVVVDANGQATDGIRVKSGLNVTDYLAAKNAEGLSGDAQTIAMIGYFLTEDEKNYAEYQLRLMINNAIDSTEETIISSDHEHSSSSDSDRATPTGANGQDENYYPKTEDGALDYQVYTGSNYNEDLGAYERVEGSTPVTRRKAYNSFINSLNSNYLKDDSEDPSDITALNYYTLELKTQYEQMLINKFADTLAMNAVEQSESAYLSDYALMLQAQQGTVATGTSSSFVTTMDSLSDTSFVLYSPSAGYGFVYNVLIPFNTRQSAYLTAFQNSNTTAAYYAERNRMAQYITGTDQRASWFNGATDYSFDAAEAGVDYYNNGTGSSYLFFEDSYTQGGTGIDRYAGKYPYQGSVTPNDDETYTLIPNKITIDDFLNELDSYLGYLNPSLSLSGTSAGDAFYSKTSGDFIADGDEYDYNYAQAIYYTGKVQGLENTTPATLLQKGSASYDAISAFNELMFAYSTDTGCLNSYLGYSIAAKGYSTSYVAEFEYAAQEAIAQGTGTVYVVLTDYGWHVIYVSYAIPADVVYQEGFVYEDRNIEGTFSYYFYQAMKEEDTSTYVEDMQSRVRELLNNDANVTIYTRRYSDLSSLG